MHPTDVAAARALDATAESGPLTVGQLGRALGLSSAAVTGLVDRLERGGLVERARDEADRRKVRVRPTPRARAVGEALLRPVAARTETAIGQLDDAQVEVVVRFLGTVLGEGEASPEELAPGATTR